MTELSTSSKVIRANVRSHGISTLLARTVSIAAFCAVALVLFRYPLGAIWLALGISIYTLLLIYYPLAWLIVIPALLPVLDLAPWTGWFFLDEFDLFVIVTVAVNLWRRETLDTRQRLITPFRLVLSMVALSYAISLAIGLFPLDPLDANAFANYFSHYNSLRVAKGFLWAILLLYLVPGHSAVQIPGAEYKRLLTLGMVLGLTALNFAVLYERFIFAGVFNFSTDLRAIATFSGLHNGGNDIEAYLVFAAPFIVAWVFTSRVPGRYLLGTAVFALTSYSLLVTFSRGGYLGFLVAWFVLVVCLVLVARSRLSMLPLLRVSLFAILLILVGSALALPILKGDFIRARFANISLDWQSRLDQLQNTFRMMDSDAVTLLFGMGLGRFPATYLAKQPAKSSPTVYTFEREPYNLFIRINAGSPMYIGQWIKVEPDKTYVLSLDVRSVDRQGMLSVPICEKQLQRSYRCQSFQFRSTQVGIWEHFEKRFDIGEVGGDLGRMTGRLSRRPVELALYNPGHGNVVDVDNVELLDEAGTNLISNGDFSNGHDRWFFTVDDLMPWQSSNHWGQIIFEQGWFGVLAFNLVVAYVLVISFLQVRQGDMFSAVVMSGVLGFLTVGLFGSLFDTPRMATLFFFASLFASRCKATAAITLDSCGTYGPGLSKRVRLL